MIDGTTDGTTGETTDETETARHPGGSEMNGHAQGQPVPGSAESGRELGFDSWKGALLALGIYTVAAVIGSAIRYCFTKKAVKDALRESGLAR